MKLKTQYRIFAWPLFLFALSVVTAPAQVTPPALEYTAKFLCGTNPTTGGLPSVAPGTYKTSINIHNPALPSPNTPPVTFLKKAVLALQEGQPLVPPSALKTDTLPPDFAEEVDCPVIRAMLGAAGGAPFIEGWVVIYVPETTGTPTSGLDVIGVYTDSLGAIQIKDAKEYSF